MDPTPFLIIAAFMFERAHSWKRKQIDKQSVRIGDHKPPHPEFLIAHVMRYIETALFHCSIRSLNIFDLRGNDDTLRWMLECLRCELVISAHNPDLKLRIGRRCHLYIPPLMLKPDYETKQL